MALAVSAALLALTVAVAGASAGPGASAAKTRTKTIKVGDDWFVRPPTGKSKTVTVRRNTLVKFKWVGENLHNVVGSGPKSFESDTFDEKGIHYKRKFGKKGTYKIICSIHGSLMQMKLKVK